MTFGKRFWGLVPWMLEITAILTFFLGKYPDIMIIVALLLFNAALSLFQERRARSATTALKQRLRIQSRVKRDGKWSVIQARELVPGDVVRIRIGDFVPADIRIVDGTLDVDQSALTGESGTVKKSGRNGELVYSGLILASATVSITVDNVEKSYPSPVTFNILFGLGNSMASIVTLGLKIPVVSNL